MALQIVTTIIVCILTLWICLFVKVFVLTDCPYHENENDFEP